MSFIGKYLNDPVFLKSHFGLMVKEEDIEQYYEFLGFWSVVLHEMVITKVSCDSALLRQSLELRYIVLKSLQRLKNCTLGEKRECFMDLYARLSDFNNEIILRIDLESSSV